MESGNFNYKIAANIVSFDDDEKVKTTEQSVAPALKAIFKDHILKQI